MDLCQHPTLRYQWMRYLPELKEDPWDPFWKRLVHGIKHYICRKDILVLRNSPFLVNIHHAKRLLARHVDEDGNPLFDDLPAPFASYISQDYTESDLDTLAEYGLKDLSQAMFIERARADLSKPTSRMKSSETNADWHSRVSRNLSLSFDDDCSPMISEIKSLDLIPLINRQWINSTAGDVIFPETADGIPIPTDLDLQLVSPEAFKLQDRKQLFVHLEAGYASNDYIRSMIIQKYQTRRLPSIQKCLEYLR